MLRCLNAGWITPNATRITPYEHEQLMSKSCNIYGGFKHAAIKTSAALEPSHKQNYCPGRTTDISARALNT
jgi:hypothetical protein